LILIGVVFLAYLAMSGRHRPVSEKSTLGLGRSRLAFGYLGVLVAALLYSYWDTVELSKYKIAEGHVTSAEADEYFWGWFLNLFCMATPLIYFFLTVVGLPLLKLLRRIGLLSMPGVFLASQAVALVVAGFVAISPDSDWCSSNRLMCGTGRYWEVAPLLGLVAVAFALASRLPWLKVVRHAS
jgi:hypothetical protein